MTREQTINLLMVIQAAYPNYRPQDKTIAVNTWFMMLGDYEYEKVMAAVKSFIATDTSGFAPSIGQVIDKIHSFESVDDITEMKAWSMVRERISSYDVMKHYNELTPTIQKAIGSPQTLRDWAMLDVKEVDTVIQSNFIRSYRNVCNREKELSRMPKDVLALIEATSQKAQIEKKDS